MFVHPCDSGGDVFAYACVCLHVFVHCTCKSAYILVHTLCVLLVSGEHIESHQMLEKINTL